jgi:hypothetical protein
MNTVKNKFVVLTTAWLAVAGVALLALGCRSLWSPNGDESEPSNMAVPSELLEQSSRLRLLALNADDYQGLTARGMPLQWHPILMPLRSHLPLSDRDFLLGTANTLGAIEDVVPAEGQCRMNMNSSGSSAPRLPNSDGEERPAEVRLELQTPDGIPLKNSLSQSFFIHDQLSRNVRAIGFWDESAQASCSLPAGRWFVSTGFGEARSHRPFVTAAGKQVTVQLKHHPRARLIIQPGKETGLQFGDLLRLGRRRAVQPALQDEGQLPGVTLLVPDDLYRPVLSPSENLDAREYLFTSLLIQRREFSIAIDPGDYVVGIWRDGTMHRCTDKLLVKSGEEALLVCDPEMLTMRLPEKGFSSLGSLQNTNDQIKTLIFDGSFLPSKILGSTSFRGWMAKTGLTRFIRAGRTIDNQHQQVQFLLQPLLQDFIGKNIRKPEGPYIGDFRLTQKKETDEKMGQANFSRLLFAQQGLNIDSILERVFSPTLSQTIPMAGSTERGFLEGVVPFTFRTTLRSENSQNFRTESAEAVVSNGAEILWIEPVPALAGATLKLGQQQHVRVRLTVPPEDTTENLAMYINGERYKLWTLERTLDKRRFRTLEIDEKITLQSDFNIAFASWGKNYLPEFMFGIRQLPALAFTRNYCIDVNENGICDR